MKWISATAPGGGEREGGRRRRRAAENKSKGGEVGQREDRKEGIRRRKGERGEACCERDLSGRPWVIAWGGLDGRGSQDWGRGRSKGWRGDAPCPSAGGEPEQTHLRH